MLDDPLVPLPATGRVFRSSRRVRLGDVTPSRRARLDACARYLQDLGNDDTADSGLDDAASVWVVRRAVVDVIVPPCWAEWVDLATWCSGTGGRWAGRRMSLTGDQGGHVEVDTLWVHVDPTSLSAARLPESFFDLYGEAAGGRRISARHWLASPATSGEHERIDWPLRTADLDVMGHVNNAAYWVAVEEVLAGERDHPAHPAQGQPVRAVMEFGTGIARGAPVQLLVQRSDKQLDIWFQVDGDTHATARLFALPRH